MAKALSVPKRRAVKPSPATPNYRELSESARRIRWRNQSPEQQKDVAELEQRHLRQDVEDLAHVVEKLADALGASAPSGG